MSAYDTTYSMFGDILENPGDWEQGEFTLKNKKTGVAIWTANLPILNYSIWRPQQIELSFFEKVELWFVIRKWRKMMAWALLNAGRVESKAPPCDTTP